MKNFYEFQKKVLRLLQSDTEFITKCDRYY